MSESDMRGEFCHLVRSRVPWPIENMLAAGIPDVYITGAWCELKWLREWPVRASTVVRLDHYTNIQRERLMERWNNGDGAYLVLQVRTNWFVFEAPAAQKVGFLTRAELEATATHWSRFKPDSEQLCSWLRRQDVA